MTGYPFGKISEVALGLLGWTPQTLWASTPHDFSRAWRVYRRLNNLEQVAEPMLRDELEHMMERFPD